LRFGDEERELAVERLLVDEDRLLADDDRLLLDEDVLPEDRRLDPLDFDLPPEPPLLRRSAILIPLLVPLGCGVSLTPWSGTIPPRSGR
jgi:hypothetical protein